MKNVNFKKTKMALLALVAVGFMMASCGGNHYRASNNIKHKPIKVRA